MTERWSVKVKSDVPGLLKKYNKSVQWPQMTQKEGLNNSAKNAGGRILPIICQCLECVFMCFYNFIFLLLNKKGNKTLDNLEHFFSSVEIKTNVVMCICLLRMKSISLHCAQTLHLFCFSSALAQLQQTNSGSFVLLNFIQKRYHNHKRVTAT